MKLESIRSHLQPYSIYNKRRTTINHAFASSIAIVEEYDRNKVAKALELLGQNPDSDLMCVYCGSSAQTWDHLRGLVKNGEYSGFGHTISNLVPCCDKCNSQKGNRDWAGFLKSKNSSDDARFREKLKILTAYSENRTLGLSYEDIQRFCPEAVRSLENARKLILSEMQKADTIAIQIRNKLNRRI